MTNTNMQDKDIIDLIRHIVYLREQIKLRDRIILRLKLESKQLKGGKNGKRSKHSRILK